MSVATAHEESLGIVSLLRRLDGVDASDAFVVVRGYLLDHALLNDVQPIIAFSDGAQKVQLEPRSPLGEEVLYEMTAFEQIPCPDGLCERYKGDGRCRWCGQPMQ